MPFLAFLRANAAFLAAGVLLSFSSSWGQTYFISVFAGEIMETFALSDGQWGLVYTGATTASAVTMVWAGTLTDRFRARALAAWVMPALALACIAMALAPTVAVLVAVIYALRLFGQGMMVQLAVVSMARWFVASRGKALSVSAMGFAVGNALLPVIFVSLLLVVEWRWLWVVAALATLAALPVISRLLRQERTPQSAAAENEVAGMQGRHWTRVEMLRHPLFWFALPMLLGPPAWGTALFFQQVHFAEVKGFALPAYAALFPVFIAFSIAGTFGSGSAIDRYGATPAVSLYLLPWAVGFFVLAWAPSLPWAAVGLAFCGIGAGIQATAPTAFWAEFYGTRHIGSIKAAAAGIMVLGSAIGPGITGLLIDAGVGIERQFAWIGVYYLAAAGCIVAGIVPARRSLAPRPA
ncbi:MAG: MFS transporter [Shimia sp.]